MGIRNVSFTLILMACVAATPVSAGLLGSTVTATLNYPNVGTVYSGPFVTTVGPGVEFGTGTLATSGYVDVTDNQVIWNANFGVTYGSGSFNGIILTFSGAPNVTNVMLNASSGITPVGFSFTANQISFNLAGVTAPSAGAQMILDVTTDSATVPEPSTVGLTALAGVAMAAARRRWSA